MAWCGCQSAWRTPTTSSPTSSGPWPDPEAGLIGDHVADAVNTSIYLDYNASTPIHPAVQAAMAPFLAGSYGNPSSGHWAGAPAAQAVARARAQIADLLGCSPGEVLFTSSGTESNNTCLLGAFWAAGDGKRHIVTTRIEHPAIIEPCHFLERLGATVTYVGVDATGMVDPEDVRRALRPDTVP